MIAVVTNEGDDAAESTTSSTSTTRAFGGQAPDIVVAAALLPTPGGLGDGWVEVSREDDPVPAEVDQNDPCATRGQPVQEGLVVRGSYDHVSSGAIVEQASVVAGVVTEGAPVPRLDDPAVVECLREGLVAQVAEGSEVAAVEQPPLDTPEGAELTGSRFEITGPGGDVLGHFDMLLLRRDRAVVFLLVAVQDTESATPLPDLVAALDEPLAAGAARLN